MFYNGFIFMLFLNFAIDFLFKYVLKNCLCFSRNFHVCHQSLELFYSLEIKVSIKLFLLSCFCDPHRDVFLDWESGSLLDLYKF